MLIIFPRGREGRVGGRYYRHNATVCIAGRKVLVVLDQMRTAKVVQVVGRGRGRLRYRMTPGQIIHRTAGRTAYIENA